MEHTGQHTDLNSDNKPGAGHVPPQEVGTEMNAVEKLEFSTEAEAILFYETVKERLLNVDRWREISGGKLSDFRLMDTEGKLLQRSAAAGDYIRIDIPGPGTQAGDGFDWVIVEAIQESVSDGVQVTSMTVRPVSKPDSKSEDTAHFLSDEATSTFQVKRLGNVIYAEEHGRNEVPNTDTDSTIDNIRNRVVGWGAKIGLSYPQWKVLVSGLLKQ